MPSTLICLLGYSLEQRDGRERREVAKSGCEEDVSKQNGDKRRLEQRKTDADDQDQSEVQNRDWGLACGSHGIFDA